MVAWAAFSSQASLMQFWSIMGRGSVLKSVVVPLRFSLFIWIIHSKWTASVLMASTLQYLSWLPGTFHMVPDTTEHELRTQLVVLYSHPTFAMCDCRFLSFFIILLSLGFLTFQPFPLAILFPPSSKLKDFPSWVKSTAYFSNPRPGTTVEHNDKWQPLVGAGERQGELARTVMSHWAHNLSERGSYLPVPGNLCHIGIKTWISFAIFQKSRDHTFQVQCSDFKILVQLKFKNIKCQIDHIWW